jgi:hypothetical protein
MFCAADWFALRPLRMHPDSCRSRWCICPVQSWKGYQVAHHVKPTDILYRDLWMSPNSSMDGGMWAPSFWVRARYQQQPANATVFRLGLLVRAQPSCLIWPPQHAHPSWGGHLQARVCFCQSSMLPCKVSCQ